MNIINIYLITFEVWDNLSHSRFGPMRRIPLPQSLPDGT